MDAEQYNASRGVRQIDKKYFVKTPFAQQLGWQARNIVRRGGNKYAARTGLQPGEKSTQQPLRESGVGLGTPRGGKRLFNFVQPQDNGSKLFRQFQSLAQALFGFAYVLIIERPGIEVHQRQFPFAGHGFGAKAFSAALHTGDEYPLGRFKTEFLALRREGVAALLQPVAQRGKSRHVGEAGVGFNELKQAILRK